MVYGYSGTMGRWGLEMADKLLEKAGIAPPKIKTARGLPDYPIIRSFVVRYPDLNAEPVEKFYERYEEAEATYQTIAELARQHKGKEAQELAVKNKQKLANLGKYRIVGDKMALIRKSIMEIDTSNLSDEEKEKQRERLVLSIIELAEQKEVK